MDDELKNFMEETERAERQMRIAQLELQIADLQAQVAELRGIDTIFLGDIGAWLDEREIELKKAARKLSADAVSDIIEMMTTQLRIARKQLKRGDKNNLKISVMILCENWNRLMQNKSLQSEKSFSARQSASGRKGANSVHAGKKLIKNIIFELAKRKDGLGDPIPADELWGDLFNCLDEKEASPEEVENRIKAYKTINYYNPDTETEEKIEYQTFRDKLKRARKK